jgi:hypothetical protein
MFSTSDLQALIEKVDGGQQGVDLVKIGQNFAQQGEKSSSEKIDKSRALIASTASARNPRRMRVALDIEGCLDRFYGGYYSGELHSDCSICLMTTTTTMMMLFNRLGLRWPIQSML